MAKSAPLVVVASEPSSAERLSVVEVGPGYCVVSTGEVLLVKWEKLRALCEWVCQEQVPIWIRTWMTPDGNELIELHQGGGLPITTSSAPASSEVF